MSFLFGGKQQKPPAPVEAPPAPTLPDAEAEARKDVKKRRKISLLSGGKTDITEGTGNVGAENIKKKKLFGE